MKQAKNIEDAQPTLKVDVKALSKEFMFRGKILFYDFKRSGFLKSY